MDEELNNRGSWENAWQKALEEPSIAPSPRVWQGLEHGLMEQQLGRYKKRLALYQGLAAASVVLLGLWAGWWLLVAEPSLQPSAAPLADTEITAPQPGTGTPSPGLPTADATSTLSEATEQIAAAQAGSAGRAADFFSSPGLSLQSSTFFVPLATAVSGSSLYNRFPAEIATAGVGLRPFYIPYAQPGAAETEQLAGGELPLSPAYLTAIKAELALQNKAPEVKVQGVMLASAAAAPAKNRNSSVWQSNGTVWLGASMSSTLFSPNISPADNGTLGMVNQQPPSKDGQVYTANIKSWNNQENSLPSVDFRLDAAFRLRSRWMVQTSLEYGTYRVGTMAGTFYNHADEENYPLYYSNFSYDKLQLASRNSRTALPIEAVNTYNFIRVPIALNYLLYDRTLGVALSSGLSTDVFLGSTIADQEKRLQAYSISAGNDSPFNRLHISGQLGLQLFYRAGHNYILTLEPSYRQALSDFSKSNSYFHSRPSNFGVSAGFRFIIH